MKIKIDTSSEERIAEQIRVGDLIRRERTSGDLDVVSAVEWRVGKGLENNADYYIRTSFYRPRGSNYDFYIIDRVEPTVENAGIGSQIMVDGTGYLKIAPVLWLSEDDEVVFNMDIDFEIKGGTEDIYWTAYVDAGSEDEGLWTVNGKVWPTS